MKITKIIITIILSVELLTVFSGVYAETDINASDTITLGGLIIGTEYSHAPSIYYELYGYLFIHGTDEADEWILSDEAADFQWYKNSIQSNIGGTPIDGANSFSYQPTVDDIGYYLYLSATGKNQYKGTVVSVPTVYPVWRTAFGGIIGSADAENGRMSGSFSIEGAAVEGATVWIYKGQQSCQWYRSDTPDNTAGEPICGATQNRYTITADDVGKYLYVVRNNAKPTSTWYDKSVSRISERVVSESVNIKSAENLWDDSPNRCYAEEIVFEPVNAIANIQWYRNDINDNSGGEPILGATYKKYEPVSEDVGKYLYCEIVPVAPFAGDIIKTKPTQSVKDTAILLCDGNGDDGAYYVLDCDIGETFDIIKYYVAYRSGYKFKGWSTEKNARVPNFDENTVVTEDTTLYAVWERISSGGGPNSGLSTDNTSALFEPTASPEATKLPDIQPTDAPEILTVVFPIIFSDIDGHWAEEYIQNAAQRSLMDGYDDGSFKPENNISIEEFTAIYARMNNLEANADSQEYSFVSSDWSRDYISALLNEMTDEQVKFAFEDSLDATKPITREQAAYLLTFDKQSGSVSKSNFIDISDSKFKENIELANQLGYFIGNPDNTFAPSTNITRAETAAVLDRIK